MAQYDTTLLSTALEFDTTNAESKCVVRITGTNKVLVAWYQSTTVVRVQAFTVNTSTGAVSAIGSPIDIETGTAGSTTNGISAILIDGSNAIVSWISVSSAVYGQLISIDGSGNCTANGSAVDLASGLTSCNSISMQLMDSTHFFYAFGYATGTDGLMKCASFNTGTGVITPIGSAIGFDTSATCIRISTAKLSSTKVLIAYRGLDSDGYAIVADVNTSTWVPANAGSSFEFIDAVTIQGTSIVAMDTAGSPMKAVIAYSQSGNVDMVAVDINTSTWAITALGSSVQIDADGTTNPMAISVNKVDSTHVLVVYEDAGATDILGLVYTYDSTTGMGSATANTATIESTANGHISTCDFTDITGGFVSVWAGASTDGFIGTLKVTLSVATSMTATLQTYTVSFKNAVLTIAMKLLATVQSYAVTFKTALFSVGRNLVATLQTYSVTFRSALFNIAMKLLATVQTYAVTFRNAILTKGARMIATLATYSLTGIAVRLLFNGYGIIYSNATKNSITPTNGTKHNATMSNATKNSSTWINDTKS